VSARRRRSRDAGQASAPGDGRPRGRRARPTAVPSPPRQARCRQATTRPRTPGPSIHCAKPGAPHPATPGPARRGPRGGSAADSAACPSGHLDTGRLDTGHRTLDVRSTGWTDVPRRDRGADRAMTSLAGARTSPRRRPPLGGPTSPGSQRLGALGHPGRPRGDGTCAWALTAATDSCLAPPGMRPRLGALLSCVGFGWYEESAMGQRKGEGVRGEAGKGKGARMRVLLGAEVAW
jgi:hypothetical protein